MRRAEDVLNIIRDRGKRGLPLEDVYRQLYNPDLYLRAYAHLYPNKGAMTRGTTEETVDAMSLEKIKAIIEAVRHERYTWTPVRRVNIPKPNGKTRPLGLPTWSDKLLQEVMRSILEAYYEPQFSEYSHGFRPDRGCHTALSHVKFTWTGTKWFIEGDIKGCFDNIDHQVLLSILAERIHDNRFLNLIGTLLRAGYMENWRYNKTYSGAPQGGVISPILSNIYMDKLDKYVETVLLPAYNRGKRRRTDESVANLRRKARRYEQKGRREEAETFRKEVEKLPIYDQYDPNYRRLRYVRYADDFLLGFAGPCDEAEEIRAHLATFLQDSLKLELSREKTLITHARNRAARFLGYDIACMWGNTRGNERGRQTLTGQVGLRVPADVIDAKCKTHMKNGKAAARPERMSDSDFTIVQRYGAEYRGIVQYYSLAHNVSWLDRLHWVMSGSLLKTLSAKHKTSMMVEQRKLRAQVETPSGSHSCFQVVVPREGKKPLVAQFGGIPLRHNSRAILVDQKTPEYGAERNELLKRLLADKCELCGSTENIEVHHIRKLSDIKVKGRAEKPLWMQIMSARRRKTLVVCHNCHTNIHAGRQTK